MPKPRDAGWLEVLAGEWNKAYYLQLMQFVAQEYRTHQVFPPKQFIFSAFDLCPFNRVKVVVLGQDPYHDDHQAHGLSFSVNDGVAKPPSLRNIFQEIESDLGVEMPASGNLEFWARQGVLLLNATLTVRAHQAGSHQKQGWEQFTRGVVRELATRKHKLVFLLWGSQARSLAEVVDQQRHLVLESAHPSPLSVYRGFRGNRHFSQTNAYLVENGESPIQWGCSK